MNAKTKYAKNAKTKYAEKIQKINIARGKIEMLDELFSALSDKQKKYSVITAPGKRRFVHEWWKGMTVTEKKVAFINLVRIEDREGEKND